MSPLARYRQLSPTASVMVSPICLGTMTFGDAQSERYGKCDKETSFKILDTFVEKGGNFLDTANVYRDGETEEWLGEWMSSRGNRDQLVLATKYTNNYLPKAADDIKVNYAGNGTKSMKLSLENSLKRLKTSYIDLFYLHIWDYTTSIPELMHSLNDLVVAGKVMYLGISDTPAWIVSKANQYARDHGLRQFSVYQGMWNVAMRDFEREIIPMALHEGMALAPYGVLNQGRFQTREGFREREKSNNEGRNFIPLNEHDKRISGVLEDLAGEREGGSVTILNMALAYVMQKAPYVFPIVGGRKVDHLLSNLEGLEITLTPAEMEVIDDATGFKHGFPTNFFNLSLFDPKQPQVMVTEAKDVKMTMGRSEIDWVAGPRPIQPNAKDE